MIGMAHVADDYPLYYEAFNEKGLGMAGLNFVGNAAYNEPDQGALNGESNIKNVAVFEFILLFGIFIPCQTDFIYTITL